MNVITSVRAFRRIFLLILICILTIFAISILNNSRIVKSQSRNSKDDGPNESRKHNLDTRLNPTKNSIIYEVVRTRRSTTKSNFIYGPKISYANIGLIATGVRQTTNTRKIREIVAPASYKNDAPFEFARNIQHFNRCELLFVSPPYDRYDMSALYHQKLQRFNLFYNQQKVNGTYEEGFTALIPEKIKALHYMAGAEFVHTICETGFNYGHSSFNFLTANPRAIVHSFDLGNHAYAKVMAGKLAEMFPGRINVHFGDSTVTVPRFIEDNPGFVCDLMFIDGGHEYLVAKADLHNFISIANKNNNVIIFDDYPTDWGGDFGRAWEELVIEQKVSEKFRCMKYAGFQRGILAGIVL